MEGTVDSIPSLVAELVRLKIDVLVVQPLVAIRAAKQATKTIPIVIVASFDPIEMGIVDSLARPRGNITGLATLGRELGGKRLELLKEVVPKYIARRAPYRCGRPRYSLLLLRNMRLWRAH